MTSQLPPRWLELALQLTLSARDRETVVGDLREEYAESSLPRLGRLRADLWYLCQTLSFLPTRLSRGATAGRNLLLPISLFTLACSCWVAAMEVVLRHPGYAMRAGVALCVALLILTTIGARILGIGVRGERWLWAGAVLLIRFGGQAFLRNVRAAHFEGFVLLISLTFVCQGVLMLITLGRPSGVKPSGERL